MPVEEVCGRPRLRYAHQVDASQVKVKICTLDIEPLRESPSQKRSGMARVLKGSHSFTCTPTRSSAIGMSHTCLRLSSIVAGTHLPTPEGRKAELAWVSGYLAGQFTCSYPTTNRAQCRAALIETNALYTKPPSTPRLGQRSFVFHCLEQSAICHVRRWLITGRISETTEETYLFGR